MTALLSPSLLFALSLVQLFGNQGILKDLLLGHTIYGPIGIVIGMTFAHFPHTFIVISTALGLAEQGEGGPRRRRKSRKAKARRAKARRSSTSVRARRWSQARAWAPMLRPSRPCTS